MTAQILVVMIVAIALSALAERRNVQAPLLLAAVGLAASFLPGLERLELDPEIILGLVLPPLLFSAATEFSFFSFMRRLGSIVNLGVYMVAGTTVFVAAVASHVIPEMSPQVALVLAAVIAPPDAVAAVAIGRKAGLSPGLMTVLKGESLINDAAALTLFSLTAATVTGFHSFINNVPLYFLYAAGLGTIIGLVIGALVHAVRLRISNPSLATVLTLIVPFATYFAAEQVHASGVLAVVAAGFSLGHNAAEADYTERMQEREVWRTLDTLLETFVFAYIGLQLRFIIQDVLATGIDPWELARVAVIVLLATIGIRIVWVFATAAIGRWRHRAGKARMEQVRNLPADHPLQAHLRRAPPVQKPFTWRENLVLSWTGMRGVVTIAAAAGIPLVTAGGDAFPQRDLIIAIAFLVTIGTLLLQGLTLPWVIRLLKVSDPDGVRREAIQRRRARKLAATASREALDEFIATTPDDDARQMAREMAERFSNESAVAKESQVRRTPEAVKLSQMVLTARRRRLIEARDNREIEDEVVREVLEQLDLEEAVTTSWAVRADQANAVPLSDADDDGLPVGPRPNPRQKRKAPRRRG